MVLIVTKPKSKIPSVPKVKKGKKTERMLVFGSDMILKCAHVVMIPGLVRKIHKLEEENAKIRRRSRILTGAVLVSFLLFLYVM
ncbi:DNAse I-like superfamily protein, partial [Prunus dulcis]